MNTHRIASALLTVVVIVVSLAIILRVQFVRALADASSTAATSSLTTPPDTTTSASSTSTPTTPPVQATSSAPAKTTAPQTLKLVHTAGTKYVDYCTDGTKITAYPGDPAIDSHFDVPNAPTPKCPAGQKWDHTSGMPGYDTPSGDLDIGEYAQQADGTYVVHYAATTYTDATSTVPWPDRITTTASDPTTITTSQTTPAPAASPTTLPSTTSATSSQ